MTQTHNKRFAAMLADGSTIGIIALFIEYQADVIHWTLVLIFVIIFSVSCDQGLDNKKFQHSSKPSTLAAIDRQRRFNN